MFGSWDMFNDVIEVGERERKVVGTVIHDYGLPLSIVGAFRHDHAMFRGLAPFVIENATKAGTLDLLMNAGPLHDAVAALSRARQLAVLGSSANRSLSGSKFRLEDVEPEVRAAAAVALDYGLCKYHNPNGLDSTIIDLTNYQTIRVGACYDQICEIILAHFAIDLRAIQR